MTREFRGPSIEVNDFSKSFGNTHAVDSLSFQAYPGEIFGFLGRNGAGKTTTIRTLLRIYEPDQGTLLVRGHPFSESRAQEVGYLPEERGLYTRANIWDTILYMGRLRSVPLKILHSRAQELLQRFELWDLRTKKIQNLSSGMQQKVQIIATLLHEPPVLILDEPFRGLDPVNRQLVFEILQEKKTQGTCILFSSHQILEIEDLCDRVILISRGKSQAYGTLEEVKSHYETSIISLIYSGNLPAMPDGCEVHDQGNRVEISYPDPSSPQEILRRLVDTGVRIHKFEIKHPSLQSIFLDLCS